MHYNDIRMKRIVIFQDTMLQCEKDSKLSENVKSSIERTVLYKNPIKITKQPQFEDTAITVTSERTFECARRLKEQYSENRIGALNFASATNAGGGVKNGSSAQEESICKCSTLFKCLDTEYLFENFYQFHRKRHNTRYTDSCIYTPDITVIKTDDEFSKPLLTEQWFKLDVLSCPAPNLNAVNITEDELFEIHKKRGTHILNVAVENGIEVLVLGAFGCGAFRNNPKTVSKAYREILKDFKGYFKEVCFAVYCSPKNDRNYQTFKNILL